MEAPIQPAPQVAQEKRELSTAEKMKIVYDFMKNELSPKTIAGLYDDVFKKALTEEELSMLQKDKQYGCEFVCAEKLSGQDKEGVLLGSADNDGIQINIYHFFKGEAFDKKSFLLNFFHEILHYLSTAESSDGEVRLINSGVMDPYINEPSPELGVIWYPLNEAITQIVTDAFYKEYLLRSGKKFNSDYVNQDLVSSYKQNMAYLSSVVSFLRRETALPPEVIVSGFIDAYMKRKSFSALFKEFDVSEETLAVIKGMKSLSGFKTIKQEMEASTEEIKEEREQEKIGIEAEFSRALFGRTPFYQKEYDKHLTGSIG
jgi:hypothetical protein